MSTDAVKNLDPAGDVFMGKLMFGIEYEGRRHHDFTMRLPTMGDNIAVTETYPEGIGMRLELAIFARCVQTLGEIPKAAITYDLLESLMPEDYDVLQNVLMDAKKKLHERIAALFPIGN